MSDGDLQRPTELVYSPRDSWAPAFVGLGVALAAVGVFSGWFVAAVGVVIALAGLVSWARTANDEVSRMRREQRTDTAVIPALPIRADRE